MAEFETYKLKRLIPIKYFETCLLGKKLSRKQITELYPTRKDGAYYLDKFSNFLKDNFEISLKEYCKKQLNINWPKCPTRNTDVGYRVCGQGIILSDFVKGGITKENCPNFRKACKIFAEERKGDGNPMFGAKPWNKGLTSKTDERVKRVAEMGRNRKVSEETRQKLRDAMARSPLKARHTQKHSEETKRKMREIKAMHWARGDFDRVSSIEQKTKDFLETLNTKEKFVHQYQVVYFTFDFAFPDAKVAIEVQGSFFHIDPRIYPNGPINAIQRRNFGRDKAKKAFTSKLGWTIIEVWEPEVNDGSFQDYLICKLQELNLLNH